MSAKAGSRELIWITAGAVGIIVFFCVALYLRNDRGPADQIAFKAQRIALVNAMRLSLAAASEAQNGAVISTGEHDSKSFADQARKATADLDSARTDLQKLLQLRRNVHELELLDRVGQTLGNFQQVNDQLLDLALQNSNRKAYSLAFGPAMKVLHEIEAPLARIASDRAGSPSENTVRILELASEIRIGILRMQVILLPHIAGESDETMNKFEQELSDEGRKVRENIALLRTLLPDNQQANIATAESQYTKFEDLKSQIIKLSRENTDIRAVAIVLKEKRQAMLACQDALVTLQNAIQSEPLATPIPAGR